MLLIGLLVVIVCLLSVNIVYCDRLYVKQFEDGSEHIPLVNIAYLSIHMGKFDYPYAKLSLESMKWNPKVQFNLINVLEEEKLKDSENIINLAKSMNVNNFNVTVISIRQFNQLVKSKFNIEVEITSEWYYKLCDFKPTLAYLFPELVDEKTYPIWGYGDNDIIWGNFSRFSNLFQPDRKIIHPSWWTAHGSSNFYANAEWSRGLFLTDTQYVKQLTTNVYHNLDEDGVRVEHVNIVDGGKHSMAEIHSQYAKDHNFNIIRGQTPQDQYFLEPEGSSEWAGAVRWFRGTIQIIHGSEYFPPGRELLYYHRISKYVDFPDAIRDNIFNDMIIYGYILPSFTPLLTRYMCKHTGVINENAMKNIVKYVPYHEDCVNKWVNYNHDHN